MTDSQQKPNALQQKLLAIAFASDTGRIPSIDLPTILSDQPLFATDAFEWQWYVDEEVRALWSELDLNARLVVYICAANRAAEVDAPD